MRMRLTVVFVFALLTGHARAAATVSIAAAANLVYVLDELNAEFSRSAPGVTLLSATGASGNLVAQIRNGAPFDVFLSADLEYAQALVRRNQAEASSLTTFATGRLVLWTTRPDLALSDITEAIRDPVLRKLAIAQVQTAPYGRAAQQALEKLGMWAEVQPKLVFGESITQTAQFVETGNADAGFIAMSLVRSPKLQGKGRWLEVPSHLHLPLSQGAVLTLRGAANPSARRYLDFLGSPSARKILLRFGYQAPNENADQPTAP